ncbi:hypothetical protein BKA82DRAFT_4517618 [Pisolithus tinctorius]|nr:hypothetical protein BKA82DRAFT_4517618 [Pisolithus tinctorius]
MDQYVFTFPPTTFGPAGGDSACPTPGFNSYNFRNLSDAPFPPNAAQSPPQPLELHNPSYGYPALDPALLAISIPRLESSLTSRPALPSSTAQVMASAHVPISCTVVDHHPDTTPAETAHSNATSVPSVTTSSTHPNNGTPNVCNGGVSVVKAAGNKSTWATQNPGQPVMQPHQPLSTVEKDHCSAHAASRQISAAQRRDRDTLLNDAIQSLANEFEMKVQAVATTHNITSEKVKKLLGSHKYYQNPRSTQLANAIIHDKANEVNEGRARGEKLSLQQIRELARADPKYQDMTQDEKDELLHALTEYRTLKNVSVRATNSAAARNAQSTLEHVFKILDGLALHTGIYACLFATRGHVYDSSQPFWYGTDNVMDFWEDVMDLEPDEIVRKLEQWACMHGKNIEEHNSVEGMQQMCARILNSGLREYSFYLLTAPDMHVAIKEKYGIELLGWPESVPFQSPRATTNAEHLHTLRDVLKAGTCRWAYMSTQQRMQHTDRLKERRIAGEAVGKPRKKRSDAGRKCRRTAPGKGKAPKSVALINSSSEDNSSMEDDE